MLARLQVANDQLKAQNVNLISKTDDLVESMNEMKKNLVILNNTVKTSSNFGKRQFSLKYPNIKQVTIGWDHYNNFASILGHNRVPCAR